MTEHPRTVELMAPLWDLYQMESYGHLLPAGDQHTECKRAFFGGAAKSIMALAHLSSVGLDVTDADIGLIDQMLGEVNAFFQAESATHNAMKN